MQYGGWQIEDEEHANLGTWQELEGQGGGLVETLGNTIIEGFIIERE